MALQTLPGLTLLEEIGRGLHSVIYRASRNEMICAVKMPLDHLNPSAHTTLAVFQREASALALVQHPGLPAVLEVGQVGSLPYLVMEYIEGQSLADILEAGPLLQTHVVTLAKALSGALAAAHRHGVIHCDVQPRNVIIDPTGNPRLIDFGFATYASVDGSNPHVLGTLRYSSPEQVGAIKRPIDGRSDLYALGGILFECLTGSPPFDSDDATELMHLHAVAMPPNITTMLPSISPGLASIINRLLAKDPDDRYQTAEGLLSDLDQLEHIDAAFQEGNPIVLGIDDQRTAALYEDELVGRSFELSQLRSFWNAARRSEGSLAILEGPSGTGKSRLGREIVHRARSAGALVLTTTCAKGGATPFGIIRMALEQYHRHVQTLPKFQRLHAEEQLRHLLRPIHPHVLRIVPDLERIVGSNPSGDSTIDHDVLCNTLAETLRQITRVHPATIWLIDDLHGIDDASLTVLQRLLARAQSEPLCIIATHEDNPHGNSVRERLCHDLQLPIHLLHIQVLNETEAMALISSFLGGYSVHPSLAEAIIARSGGSPFAIREYVQTVLDAGMLRLIDGIWQINREDLARLELPPQIVPLLLRRIEGLSQPSRSVLRMAGMLGSSFRHSELALICQGDVHVVNEALNEAIRAHLIERTASGSYHFIHERIHAAITATVEEGALRAAHQHIAEMLDTVKQSDLESIYRIARHYSRGRNPWHAQRIYETNIAAGTMAFANFDYLEAYEFFSVAYAQAALIEQPFDPLIEALLGEVCYRIGNVAEAINHLDQAINRTTTSFDRARLRIKRTEIQLWSHDAAISEGEISQAFHELQARYPQTRLECIREIVQAGFELFLGRLGAWMQRTIDNQKQQQRTILESLHLLVAHRAAGQGNYLLQTAMLVRSLANAERLGPSTQLINSYCATALFVAFNGFEQLALGYFDRAQSIARQLNERPVLARVSLLRGIGLHMLGQSRQAERLLRRCLEDEIRWLDVLEYVQGCSDLAWDLLIRGHIYDAWEWTQRAMKHAQQASPHSDANQLHTPMTASTLLAILGNEHLSHEYLQQASKLARNAPFDQSRHAALLCAQLAAALVQGASDQELDTIIQEGQHLPILNPRWAQFHIRHWFVFRAYARLLQAQRAPLLRRIQAMHRLRRALRDLKRAEQIPALKAHADVISGAEARLRGHYQRALSCLGKAEALAYTIDSPWVLMEAAYQRALILALQGDQVQSRNEARRAYQLAQAQGWKSRARAIQIECGLDDADQRVTQTNLLGSNAQIADTLRLQRNLDALLNVSLAWTRVHNPDQQSKIALDAIIRILGAERGFLFLSHNGTPVFQAGRDASGHDLHSLESPSRTLIERVVITREPIVASGIDDVMGLGLPPNQQLRSILAAPLLLDETNLLGVIYLDHRLVWGMFSPDDLEILQAIASHIALALETRRTAQLEISIEAERQQRRLAETLRRLGDALYTSLDLEVVLNQALEALSELIPYTSGSIVLCKDNQGHFVALRGQQNPEALRAMTLDISQTPLFLALHSTQRPLVISNVADDQRFKNYGANEVASWLGVPLCVRDGVVGFVALDRSMGEPFSERDADIGMVFANQAAVAIENARLFGEVRRLAITDGLTGVWTRRHFFEQGEREWHRTRRYDHPLSAMMIDVDHFKRINDTQGHAIGDLVLATLTETCRAVLRTTDMIGRYGGEEFAVLLPDTDLSAAHATAERLREAVAAVKIYGKHDAEFSITVSIGVASATEDMASLATLLDRADRGLYIAKDTGRNRVVMA